MSRIVEIFSQINIDESELEISKAVPTSETITRGLEVVFGIMAIVAMLVIVVSGLLFTLSRGNPEKASRARNGIIYSAVGLVVAMSAFAIVRFAIKGAI